MKCYISHTYFPQDGYESVLHVVEQELLRAHALGMDLCVMPYTFASALEAALPALLPYTCASARKHSLTCDLARVVKQAHVALLFPVYELINHQPELRCYLQTDRKLTRADHATYLGFSFDCIIEGAHVASAYVHEASYAFYFVTTPFSLNDIDAAGFAGYELSSEHYRRFDESFKRMQKPLIIVSGVGYHRAQVFIGSSFVLSALQPQAPAAPALSCDPLCFEITKTSSDGASARNDQSARANDLRFTQVQSTQQGECAFCDVSTSDFPAGTNVPAETNASGTINASGTAHDLQAANPPAPTVSADQKTISSQVTGADAASSADGITTAAVPAMSAIPTLPRILTVCATSKDAASHGNSSDTSLAARRMRAYQLVWDALVFALGQQLQAAHTQGVAILLDGSYTSYLLCLLACDAGLRAHTILVLPPRAASEHRKLSFAFARALNISYTSLENLSFGRGFETLADKEQAREWACMRKMQSIARAHHASVLSGISKTACLLGEGSFFDECADLAPFADLMETELIQLAQLRLKHEAGVFAQALEYLPSPRDERACDGYSVSRYSLDLCITYALNLLWYGTTQYASDLLYIVGSFAATTPLGDALYRVVCARIKDLPHNRAARVPAIALGGLSLAECAGKRACVPLKASTDQMEDFLNQLLTAHGPQAQIVVSSPEATLKLLSELLSSTPHHSMPRLVRQRRRRRSVQRTNAHEESIEEIVDDILASDAQYEPEAFYIVDNKLNPSIYAKSSDAVCAQNDAHATFSQLIDETLAQRQAESHLKGVLSILRDFCQSDAFCTRLESKNSSCDDEAASSHEHPSFLDSEVGELRSRIEKNPFSEN